MLTVAKVSAGGGAAYASYLEGRAQAPEQGDYYLKDGERVEAPGRWALGPGGAAALGVDRSRPVEGDAFHALMAVRHPVSGEQLRRVGANGEAVVAIDATFSAPKSVSAVWALGSPEVRTALEAAQERAVDRALAHARSSCRWFAAAWIRRRSCANAPREVLASSWQHTTARAVAGQVRRSAAALARPDPRGAALGWQGRRGGVAGVAGASARDRRGLPLGARARAARAGFEVERATGRGRTLLRAGRCP